MKIKKIISSVLLLSLLITMGGITGKVYAAEKKYKFALSTVMVSISFWVPVRKGMEDAAKLLDVEAVFMGPISGEVAKQRDITENLIEAGYDGLAIAYCDPLMFDKLTQKALDLGIPVIAFNVDDAPPGYAPMSYIGQDLVKSGRILASEAVELIGEGAKAVLLTCAPGETDLEMRLKGAKEILDEHNVKYEVIDGTGDVLKAMGIIESYYLGHPDTDAFLSVDAVTTEAAGRAVEKSDLKGKVVAAGFDLVPETLRCIKEGYLAFTIDQYPYLQGFYSIMALYLYKEYGMYPSNIDTGAGIIDASNVDQSIELSEKGWR